MNKIKICGIVNTIIFSNLENYFYILSIYLDGLIEVTVTINSLNRIHEGVTMEFEGQWIDTKKYGKQFKADSATETMPKTVEGLVKYLSSDFFPGIGKVIATRIIAAIGKDKVLDVFNNSPDDLLKIQGISKKKLQALKDKWEENKEINSIMFF